MSDLVNGPHLLLLGALSAGSVAALLAWSRHLPKAPQVALAAFTAAALLVAVLEVHFIGRTRGNVQEWVAVAATVLAVLGGGPATTAVFTLVDHTAAAASSGSSTSSAAGSPASAAAQDGVGEGLRGGAWIGALERLAIVGTLVGGWPEGMVVVLAIKALGRYPELRRGERPRAAEGFIIGTLVSIQWAVACAYVITGGMIGGLRVIGP